MDVLNFATKTLVVYQHAFVTKLFFKPALEHSEGKEKFDQKK